MTYGSTDEKKELMVEAHTMDVLDETPSLIINPMNPFNEEFDSAFWKEVACVEEEQNKKRIELNKTREKDQQLPVLTINEVETRLRLEKIEERLKAKKIDDVLVYLLVTHYDSYMNDINNEQVSELKDNYVKKLSEFSIILLKEDYCGKHSFDITEEDFKPVNSFDKSSPTIVRTYKNLVLLPESPGSTTRKANILHIAAERNLCEIAECFTQFYPTSVSVTTQTRTDIPVEQRRKLQPVQIAIDAKQDDVCAVIMKNMTNERVRQLFQSNNPKLKAANNFVDLIKHPNMKQTVLCVLDTLINPNFPYIREDESKKNKLAESGQEVWSKIPDVPLQYNFLFQLLDGDVNGRPPRTFDESNGVDKIGKPNDAFLHRTPSALQVIANSATTTKDSDDTTLDPINHPVVRQLVREKWNKYGHRTVMAYSMMYLFFLLNMAVALFLGAMAESPTQYPHGVDKLRGICEVITLLFTMFYIFMEVEQFCKEREIYCSDGYNLFDVIGLLAIIALLPCRFAGAITVARSISVIAFFVNFIRVFKFSVVLPEEYGVYSKTFAQIVYTDIKKFTVLFVIVMMAFAGSVYIALIASSSLNDNFKNFLDVFLQELRALLEGKEFADSYSSYNIALTLFILLNMGSIIVILSNILIGQLSYRYETAMTEATTQYDIDKAKWVTSLERSWFPCEALNKRTKYYRPGIYVSKKDMDADLLVYWNKQISSEDEAKTAIKSMLEKKILKRK